MIIGDPPPKRAKRSIACLEDFLAGASEAPVDSTHLKPARSATPVYEPSVLSPA